MLEKCTWNFLYRLCIAGHLRCGDGSPQPKPSFLHGFGVQRYTWWLNQPIWNMIQKKFNPSWLQSKLTNDPTPTLKVCGGRYPIKISRQKLFVRTPPTSQFTPGSFQEGKTAAPFSMAEHRWVSLVGFTVALVHPITGD